MTGSYLGPPPPVDGYAPPFRPAPDPSTQREVARLRREVELLRLELRALRNREFAAWPRLTLVEAAKLLEELTSQGKANSDGFSA